MNPCGPEISRASVVCRQSAHGGKHIKAKELIGHILAMRLHVDDCRSASFQPIAVVANSLCLDEPEKPQDASTQEWFAEDSRLART